MQKSILIAIALFLVGCGSGAVPTMTPADLSSPRMDGLMPRTIAVSVKDERQVTGEDRQATEQEVLQAFNAVFEREGIRAADNSPNRLVVELRRPSASVADIDPEACVEMLGNLRFGDSRTMKATALGCAEVRNGFGMSYGGNVSGAFQYAANTLLTQIDQAYDGASEPLVFESEKIQTPAFPDVGVNTLALSVADEYSEDDSLGRNVREQLTLALTEAGVSVDAAAVQTLKLTLSHPSEDFAGRDKATCIALEATADLERGTVFGIGTSCRGLTESNHHEVLSETLRVLWSEYAKLIGK